MPRRLLQHLPAQLPGFLVVGTIGLFVDAAVLAALVYGLGWGNYESRAVSFGIALTVTWLLNREYVFSAGKLPSAGQEYGRYIALQCISMLVNLGVYTLCIATREMLASLPLLALAAGCASGLIFNFAGMRYLVFTGESAAAIQVLDPDQ